ncbi:hypothetical protein MIND_01318200 [Mycena indigotica]|uniref:F-box domain-containing protein n=1 Tax=Mycena indigotica TaxID=2126181 RepID=A0A8H6S176_9AGAR|nr:uncharacterized protein MIND_01318200 [Mycena indigotica]KAF7290773.1 hypothetical protein MIND_01318200 [Mycena indigotica]
MHELLLISDIVENIFQHFGSGSLAVLARTCRAFHEEAVDALWTQQTTLENILNLLPDDTFRASTADYFDAHYETFDLCRPLQPADWTRALTYTRRIKILVLEASEARHSEGYSTWSGFPLKNQVQAISASFPSSGIIFPNLRHLTWVTNPYKSDVSHLLVSFLSPNILHLNVGGTLRAAEALNSGAVLLSNATYIAFRSWGALPSNTLDKLILSTWNLHSLSLPRIDRIILQHLTQQPSLRYLELYDPEAGDCGPSDVPLVLHEPPIVSGLISLKLQQTSLKFASELIKLLGPFSSSLKQFSISRPDLFKANELEAFLATVGSSLKPSTLQKLQIFDSNRLYLLPGEYVEIQAAMDQYTSDASSLDSLASFSKLHTLRIATYTGFRIDDDALERLAQCWPNLKSLRLCSMCRKQTPPLTTLAGFFALSQHCPLLEDLTMAVDATDVAPEHPRPFVKSPLHFLHVKESPIDDAEAVAKYLSGTFPALHSVYAYYGGRVLKRNREAVSKWTEVYYLMAKE